MLLEYINNELGDSSVLTREGNQAYVRKSIKKEDGSDIKTSFGLLFLYNFASKALAYCSMSLIKGV